MGYTGRPHLKPSGDWRVAWWVECSTEQEAMGPEQPHGHMNQGLGCVAFVLALGTEAGECL